jgi:hypothetical protein
VRLFPSFTRIRFTKAIEPFSTGTEFALPVFFQRGHGAALILPVLADNQNSNKSGPIHIIIERHIGADEAVFPTMTSARRGVVCGVVWCVCGVCWGCPNNSI